MQESTTYQQKRKRLLSFLHSTGFRKYFTNTSWLLADNVINLLVAFAIGIFVARYLQPSNYGLLSFAKSAGKFFSVIGALGLEKIVIKQLIYSKGQTGKILGSALGLKMTTSVLLLILFSIAGMFVITDTDTYVLILCFISVSAIESFVVIKYYFQSKVESRFISRVIVFRIIISSLVKVGLIYMKAPLLYFALEAILESLIGVVGFIIVFRKRGDESAQRWSFEGTYAASLLKQSWPLLISSFVVYIYMELDIIMIKYMLGNEAVGNYSIAARLTTICYLGGSIICGSLFPAILNARKNDLHLYQKRFSWLLRGLVAISAVVSLGVFVFGSFFILNLFGESYRESIPSLNILIWSVPFVYVGVAGSQWYIAESMQKVLLTRTALGAGVNILLNILLIPRYGITGAAIATLAAQICASFLGNALSEKTRVLFFMQLKAFIFSNGYAKQS